MARPQLQIHIPIVHPDGTRTFLTNSITEIGAFDGPGQMLDAHKLAAAACRGLAKCLMRRFKIGLELYKNDDAPTWQQAWQSLFEFAANQRKPNGDAEHKALGNEMRDTLKAAKISSENLLDRFDDAYQIVHEMAKNKPATPSMEEEPEEEDLEALLAHVETWGDSYRLVVAMLGFANTEAVRKALRAVHGGDQESLKKATTVENWVLIRDYLEANEQ
jgi:hypothetical protein